MNAFKRSKQDIYFSIIGNDKPKQIRSQRVRRARVKALKKCFITLALASPFLCVLFIVGGY